MQSSLHSFDAAFGNSWQTDVAAQVSGAMLTEHTSSPPLHLHFRQRWRPVVQLWMQAGLQPLNMCSLSKSLRTLGAQKAGLVEGIHRSPRSRQGMI